MRNTQLPSPPVSPRTGACSSASPAVAPPASVHTVRATATVPTDHLASTHIPSTRSSASTHTPIQTQRSTQTRGGTLEAELDAHRASVKAFVHEVLRWSRMSTGALQTALCYLETAQVKVPNLQMQMREGESQFPPAPDTPNPLLCPRQAFLASLILASKFTQDRTYLNRAWVRLQGSSCAK